MTLAIDNSERRAPAAFNDELELEVSRRIERDSGSAYQINGKEARARDVQLLFADAATGAHSPALVSQGHVGALINAEPQDRRAILEEAAGISGLHSRRNEAERRLRAAEANLVRLHDVMQGIEGQLASLRRQAAQARRYRRSAPKFPDVRPSTSIISGGRRARRSQAAKPGFAMPRPCRSSYRRLPASPPRKPTWPPASPRFAMMKQRRPRRCAIAALDSLTAEEQRLAGLRAKLLGRLDHSAQDAAREQAVIAANSACRSHASRAPMEVPRRHGMISKRERWPLKPWPKRPRRHARPMPSLTR